LRVLVLAIVSASCWAVEIVISYRITGSAAEAVAAANDKQTVSSKTLK
jgi:hypothetical protein